MEKVPQIRLFGTGQSFRRKHSPSFNTQLHYQQRFVTSNNYNTNFTKPFAATMNIQDNVRDNYFQSNIMGTSTDNGFRKSEYGSKGYRCQSSNSKPNSKANSNPFNTNYYQNAIKICEQNRVLNKKSQMKSQNYLVKGSYLQYYTHLKPQKYHFHQENNQFIQNKNCLNQQCQQRSHQQQPCRKCIQQRHQLQKVNKINQININKKIQEDTIGKTITGYINDNHFSNNSLKQEPFALHLTGSNTVSFQQITNRVPAQQIQKQRLTSRQISILNSLNTQRSQTNPLKNLSSNSLNQKNNILADKADKLTTMNKIQTKIVNLPNFQKLISQLNQNDSSLRKNQYLIQQLQQISKQSLQLKRDYIRKLDQIIGQFSDRKQYINNSHIQVVPFVKQESNKLENDKNSKIFLQKGLAGHNENNSYLNQNFYLNIEQPISSYQNNKYSQSPRNSNNLQNSVSMDSLRKRKKLFVTQAQHNLN